MTKTVSGLGIARSQSWQGKVVYRIFRGAVSAKRISSQTRHDVYDLATGRDCTKWYPRSWQSKMVAWKREADSDWTFLTEDGDIRSTIDQMLTAGLTRWPPPPPARPYDPAEQQP